jgi:hypothetical protein
VLCDECDVEFTGASLVCRRALAASSQSRAALPR